MDVKFMAYQINALASELSEAGWEVTVTCVELSDGMHVRTLARRDGIEVESLYVHPKEGSDG